MKHTFYLSCSFFFQRFKLHQLSEKHKRNGTPWSDCGSANGVGKMTFEQKCQQYYSKTHLMIQASTERNHWLWNAWHLPAFAFYSNHFCNRLHLQIFFSLLVPTSHSMPMKYSRTSLASSPHKARRSKGRCQSQCWG